MTRSFLAQEGVYEPEWLVVDADNQVVGRLATRIAMMLMGKHKPTYTPHVDTGDYVVVLNAERVRFGGRPEVHATHPYYTQKMANKKYDYYTKYPGGLKSAKAADLIVRKPEDILIYAVKRMMPKNALGKRMMAKLKIYRGNQHPHQAQNPKPVALS